MALERHGCVGGDTGWQPSHLLAKDEAGQLVGAVPLYLKQHSYGEFVFDFSWAQASHRLGRHYYPKLVSAIPFVPSTGPRIGACDAKVRGALAAALGALPQQQQLSSAHVLFADEEDGALLSRSGWDERNDLQYQWFNRDYSSFDDFVAALSSDKRKKLLRERRRVSEAGIRFTVAPGDALSEAQWQQIYMLYANTYEERGQPPYLSLNFFLDYGRRPGTPMHVILGYESQRMVAAALVLKGGDTLYGRHWGAAEHFNGLHFECCYHQGIQFCIEQGMRRYDAGTQGEHKLSRGFEPVKTRSYHRLSHKPLKQAVAEFLALERQQVVLRHEELSRHTPYRTDSPLPRTPHPGMG